MLDFCEQFTHELCIRKRCLFSSFTKDVSSIAQHERVTKMLAKTAGKTNHIAHSNFDYIIKSIREKDGET